VVVGHVKGGDHHYRFADKQVEQVSEKADVITDGLATVQKSKDNRSQQKN
jgi:hypothetical protein